jgi:Cof subfamily protein (haloacid dehalogenase superfamily)
MSQAKYKMIAIDLDGTLLSPAGQVTPKTKAAVRACLNSGILICFATGRNWTESKMVLEAVEHYATAVFVGGAMVIDTGQQITLHKAHVEPKLAQDICRVLENAGHAVLALQDTEPAGVDYLISADIDLNPETEHWMKLTRAAVRRVSKLPDHSHEHTVRLGIVAAPDEVAQVKLELEQRFAERVFMQNLFVPTAKVNVLEIFDPSVNKWEGILHVARRHEIQPHEIIAIGDDLNDLSMIEHAGLGVAMGNAREEIKAIAKRVIGTNKDEGLATFLEELVSQHAVQTLRDDAAA